MVLRSDPDLRARRVVVREIIFAVTPMKRALCTGPGVSEARRQHPGRPKDPRGVIPADGSGVHMGPQSHGRAPMSTRHKTVTVNISTVRGTVAVCGTPYGTTRDGVPRGGFGPTRSRTPPGHNVEAVLLQPVLHNLGRQFGPRRPAHGPEPRHPIRAQCGCCDGVPTAQLRVTWQAAPFATAVWCCERGRPPARVGTGRAQRCSIRMPGVVRRCRHW